MHKNGKEIKLKDYYKKQMKKYFTLYEKAIIAGDEKQQAYTMQEYLNYQKLFKQCS